MVVWITGRPASGKTTLGLELVAAFGRAGQKATLVDSDEVRLHLTPQPTYGADERALVYRAIAYAARRLSEEGILAVVAATAHDEALRDAARTICPGLFLIHARCAATTCESRDPKALYRSARARDSGSMPGVHVAWVDPIDADAEVDTAVKVEPARIEELVARVMQLGVHALHPPVPRSPPR